MTSRPWLERLISQIEACLELGSLGGIDVRYNESEEQLIIAPDIAELVGGPDDGEEVFPFFSLHVTALLEVFEKHPEVTWHTMHDELWVEGRIDGQDAFVIFRRHPFDDAGPANQVVDGGTLRDKRDGKE